MDSNDVFGVEEINALVSNAYTTISTNSIIVMSSSHK